MNTNKLMKTILVGISLLFITNSLFAQSNDDCFMCHEDHSLTMTRGGKSISIFMDSKSLIGTAHEKVKCVKCHTDALVKEFPHPDNLKDVECGSCHTAFQEQLSLDVHHKLKDRDITNAPNCGSCHGHTHQVKKLSKIKDKNKEFCGKCHTEDMLAIPYHTQSGINKECIECHKDKNKDIDFQKELSKSVHSSLFCSNCHAFSVNNIELHQTDSSNHVKNADCYLCHSSIAATHRESIHGISLSEGINEAAQCWNCHGAHNIIPVKDTSSMVYPTHLVKTCGKCHDDPDFMVKFNSSIKSPGRMYSTSVHGKLVESGRLDAATCTTCHGDHDIKNRIQPGSKISSINVPNTCAKCHKKITEEYKKSIHWIAVKKGVRESPTCNTCHSEHSIHAINGVDKREAMRKIQEETCLQCHQNLLLSQRYGLETGSARSYQDSYHGLSSRLGNERSALCVDCHGVHNILPATHEESTVSYKNVVITCKKCHEESNETFANSYSHTKDKCCESNFVERIVTTIYIWLIIILIGGMIVHNLIIYLHEVKSKYKKTKNEIKIPRFTKNEFIQHIILATSFIILAITGFQLKFSDNWITETLTSIGYDESVRRMIHRVSAVIMTALSGYHVYYLLFTSRGRDVLFGLFPKKNDFKLAVQNISYHLNIRKKHPEFDNYNYMEKLEYWALIWGTFVMVLTGFILWFPTLIGDWAPLWFIKVSEIFHFYEAILATLAIIFWHWFFVIFRPKEYPLSFIAIDGKITLAHYKEEHMLKFKKIVADWMEVKTGVKDKKKMNSYTKLFIEALEKQGVDIDEFFQQEIDKNEDLKDFVGQKVSKNK